MLVFNLMGISVGARIRGKGKRSGIGKYIMRPPWAGQVVRGSQAYDSGGCLRQAVICTYGRCCQARPRLSRVPVAYSHWYTGDVHGDNGGYARDTRWKVGELRMMGEDDYGEYVHERAGLGEHNETDRGVCEPGGCRALSGTAPYLRRLLCDPWA
ncbi:hypothetical protein B0H19DRAFT_1071522 [Mycena capillaripes]|nr:hypothetical protein B0H19DRAFT_1071522 [Mycena capillaripes]